jgi:hypothetical protein
MNREKGPVRRVLLSEKEAYRASSLLDRLRQSSCKVDTSKLINEIVCLFFEKYEDTHFEEIRKRFVDKKSLLKKLISDATDDNLEETIRDYLSESTVKTRKRRKKKIIEVTLGKDEVTGS